MNTCGSGPAEECQRLKPWIVLLRSAAAGESPFLCFAVDRSEAEAKAKHHIRRLGFKEWIADAFPAEEYHERLRKRQAKKGEMSKNEGGR